MSELSGLSVKAGVKKPATTGKIEIFGAREHNLKNFDISLPRNKLIVVTGLSGSGKSSLAFDTLYAEGQRRFMETFSAYARQYIGGMRRPEVEKIEGLTPVISIEQKTVSRNPRSTVGTITELYDFLRLLYAKTAEAYSRHTGQKMVQFSDDQIYDNIKEQFSGKSIQIFSPLVRARKGIYQELFTRLHKAGYTKARIDGEICDISPDIRLTRYKTHDIDLLIDRIKVSGKEQTRLKESVMLGLKHSAGTIYIEESHTNRIAHFSRNLMCPDTGISYDKPEPNTFSFNTPYGYCPECRGTGALDMPDREKFFPSAKNNTLKDAVQQLEAFTGREETAYFNFIRKKYNISDNTPVTEIPAEAINELWYGSQEIESVPPKMQHYAIVHEGYMPAIREKVDHFSMYKQERFREMYFSYLPCESCKGYRLKDEALWFFLAGKHIGESASLQLNHFNEWLDQVSSTFNDRQKLLGEEILHELRQRTRFLLDVGLDYLSLNRPAFSLSGGEAQRTRLATQIGTSLINVTYILDEPSIGLHQRDNHLLIKSLNNLRDTGNTVIVVEHDKDMILAADHVVDLGPGAGIHGGFLSAEGTPEKVSASDTLTGDYLSGKKVIEVPENRRPGNGNAIKVKGASGNNLKKVNLELPLGKLICITGVSGSGKSTLVNETLIPALRRKLKLLTPVPLAHRKISGYEHIDKVIEINQAPIGRTPRSNPATYTGVFTHIRQLFSSLPESKVRGYKQGRFSFNLKGGRCENCEGGGVKLLEMNFLPDVHVECPDCLGKRYNRQTLEVRFKGKSISDVLDMSIEDALTFFDAIPKIRNKLSTLNQVGLGYLRVGQPSTTLSGGEAQRVKLATELSKKDTGKTLYTLDEPTTGLHFEDIRILMQVLAKLVDKGNTVLIIEHNMDVIKLADHIIDIGPEGGDRGGKITFSGTPEEMLKLKNNHTAKFLLQEL